MISDNISSKDLVNWAAKLPILDIFSASLFACFSSTISCVCFIFCFAALVPEIIKSLNSPPSLLAICSSLISTFGRVVVRGIFSSSLVSLSRSFFSSLTVTILVSPCWFWFSFSSSSLDFLVSEIICTNMLCYKDIIDSLKDYQFKFLIVLRLEADEKICSYSIQKVSTERSHSSVYLYKFKI